MLTGESILLPAHSVNSLSIPCSVEDSNFLNQLQKGVTRWIREMQKVTRLDPDPSTGSTMQEISFWHNMDRALQTLKIQRDSPEIVLTLEILKLGKRFHATVGYAFFLTTSYWTQLLAPDSIPTRAC